MIVGVLRDWLTGVLVWGKAGVATSATVFLEDGKKQSFDNLRMDL